LTKKRIKYSIETFLYSTQLVNEDANTKNENLFYMKKIKQKTQKKKAKLLENRKQFAALKLLKHKLICFLLK